MAIRYLKIEVIKELVSDVYLKVDDADPQFAPVVEPEQDLGGGRAFPASLWLTPALKKLAEEAAADLDSSDWDDQGVSASGTIEEVTEEAANDYAVWDETKRQPGAG